MKSFIVGILFILLFVTSCKKAKVETPQAPLKSLQVLEAFTNKPIAGATVTFEKCIQSSFPMGCSRTAPAGTYTTNLEGKVYYNTPGSIVSIIIAHQNYWSNYSDGTSGSYTLNPKCTIMATIKKIKSYAADMVLTINVSDPGCMSYDCWFNEKSVGQPVDTVMYIQGKGFAENSITWNIGSIHSSLPAKYINGFDTVNVSIEY